MPEKAIVGIVNIVVVTLVRESQKSFGVEDERECDPYHEDEVWKDPVCQRISEPGTVCKVLEWIGTLSVDQDHEDYADPSQEIQGSKSLWFGRY